MVTGSALLGPLSDYTANCRPVLSSERPHISDSNISTESNTTSQVPQGCSIPRHTDWLASHKVTSNFVAGLPSCWGKYMQESFPPGWGSLKNRDIKICSTENYRPNFSSERAPHILKSVTVLIAFCIQIALSTLLRNSLKTESLLSSKI
jgi:hypothetical protein